jgi:hypothetical protein
MEKECRIMKKWAIVGIVVAGVVAMLYDSASAFGHRRRGCCNDYSNSCGGCNSSPCQSSCGGCQQTSWNGGYQTRTCCYGGYGTTTNEGQAAPQGQPQTNWQGPPQGTWQGQPGWQGPSGQRQSGYGPTPAPSEGTTSREARKVPFQTPPEPPMVDQGRQHSGNQGMTTERSNAVKKTGSKSDENKSGSKDEKKKTSSDESNKDNDESSSIPEGSDPNYEE